MNEDAIVNQIFNLVPNREGYFTNPHRGRVYAVDGIAPCLNCCGGGNLEPKILLTYDKVPMANDKLVVPFNTAEHGIAYTITTRYGAMCASNLIDGNFPMTGILVIDNPTEEMKQQIDNGTMDFDRGLPKPQEPKACAMRGRETSAGYAQVLEVGDNISNALTTVQKDSLVLEPTILRIVPWNNPGGEMHDVAPTITTSAFEQNTFVKEPKPAIMADPRKNYGRMQLSEETSPTLLSTDYKSPHLVMEDINQNAQSEEPKVSVHPLSHAHEFKGKENFKPISPALRATDYKAPHCVMETAENLQRIAQQARHCKVGVTINPDNSLRPFNAETKAKDGISELCTDYDESVGSTNIAARPNNVYGNATRYRIRKLTPRECYRLMDVPEQNIDRLLNSGISKSQHYKLAGNSIVVSCLYHIFKQLFTNAIPVNQQLSLF